MSDLTQDMASPKAVREWCRVTCADYPDVQIRDMSTSFRDGLAFCAIIHNHRPDLIDFSSLCKANVYHNNKTAFEVAERKLGIPALLEPKDMVSTKAPDCLSVITYLSQYYYFFNRKSYAGLASSRSSHVTFLNSLAKSKPPDGLKRLKSQTDLETSRGDRLYNRKPRTVCNVCFKPVHLIQRHLTEGKVYHRSCFRCKVCRSILLPESYTRGGDDGSLICTHHVTDGKSTSVDLNKQVGPADNLPKSKFQAGYFSLGGLAISSVPHYTEPTESQDRLVCKTPETEGRERQQRTVGLKCTAKKPVPPRLPPPGVEGGGDVKGAEKAGPASLLAESKTQQEKTKTRGASELSSPCARVTGGSSRPVPAPRRMLDPSAAPVPVPVPVPRTKAAMNSSPAKGNLSSQKKCSSNPSHITSPTRDGPKVQTNHPWINIIHPGPWTQLPPAPPPVPAPRSKLVSNTRRSWNSPRVPPPSPFEEEVDEDTPKEGTKPEPADQTEPSAAAIRSGNGGTRRNTPGDADALVCSREDSAIKSTPDDVGASSEPARETSKLVSDLDETGNAKGSPPDVTEAAAEAQSHVLPRSLSVPAVTSARSQSSLLSLDLTEATESDQVVSCRSKPACKENPFDRKPAMPKSKTFQDLPSTRAPAPGHGFPLIKRKVQTDQNVSTEDLQVEMRELEKHLEALEQKGVELERNLRDHKNDEDEEQMLMEWFSLIHERHVLMRRDTELVHLTKQQKLEERQADVEYELRCLLNKPVSDWSREDRGREQQLMDELVAVIERRNQIVSSLDQDRQRESGEDVLLEAMMTNKEIQKEGLKELKKSKTKFKPAKFFKMLNHKAESNKDSTDKKS